MRSLIRRSLLVLIVVSVPGLVCAQGLGDVAAKEKQKRQAAPKTKTPRHHERRPEDGRGQQVEVRDDERRLADDGAHADGQQQSGTARGAAAPRAAPIRSSRRSRRRRTQVDSARSAVVAAEAHVKELGDKLNPMSPSFIYAQGQTGDAAGEEIRTREALKGAEAQLASARDALVVANRDFEDVRQGRRRSSDR